MVTLVFDTVGSGQKQAWVLHGILGSRKNWRSFAKRLSSTHPGWTLKVIDLRCHGDSEGDGPHSVHSASDDLVDFAREQGAPDLIIGHSFGGKVAMLAAAALGPSCAVAALDALPGRIPEADRDNHVTQIFATLAQVPMPILSRQALVAVLKSHGLPDSVAMWMTTNLRRTGEGLVWTFDLAGARAMLLSYFDLDLWEWLQTTDNEVWFVRAEQSDRWSTHVLVTFDELQRRRSNIHLTLLRDSGHWVHVNNPDGLLVTLEPVFSKI